MAERIGLLLPASVIIHLANVLLLQIPLPYNSPPFIHISFQRFDENALKLIFQNIGYPGLQEYSFPDYIMPVSCV